MSKIINVCLVKHDIDLSDFQITHDDGTAVRADNWQFLIRRELHSVIPINLNFLTSNIQESILAIEEPSIPKAPSSARNGVDSDDSTDLVVPEEQDSGDEVRMPSRRTTFDRDQASQGLSHPRRLSPTQSPSIEQTGSELEPTRQSWALVRRVSFKDDFAPFERHADSSDAVVVPRPRKGQKQRATRPSISTALIRASKIADNRGTYTSASSSRDRKYPKKVSIEVINDEDEEDNLDIYYTPKSLDPRKSVRLQDSALPQKAQLNIDDDCVPIQTKKLDSMPVLLDKLIQSIELSSIFPGSGQDDARVPPALSWKARKPPELADIEMESHNRLSGQSRRCLTSFQGSNLTANLSDRPSKTSRRSKAERSAGRYHR